MKKLALLICALLFAVPAHANLETASGVVPEEPPAYDTVEIADIPSNFTIEDYMTDNRSYEAGCTTGLEPECLPNTTAGTNPSDEASFRTVCEPSHLGYDDPLLYPGSAGASHLHRFWGNTLTDADSTYSSLRSTGSSTCAGGKINRSAYWTPALLKDDVECDASHSGTETCAIVPAGAVVYYKVNRTNIPYTVRYPRGFGYVFGFNMATGVKGDGFKGWSCVDTGAGAAYLANTDGTAAFECPSTSLIVMEFSAPGCWNGEDLTSANGRDHVSHQVTTAYNAACPATHPYMIPHFTFRNYFSHEGSADYKTWYFSSDRMEGYPTFRNGESAHSDWFGAWDYGTLADPGVMLDWQTHCNGLSGDADDVRSCVGSQTGTTERMCHGTGSGCPAGDLVFQSTLTAVPLASRYEALPTDPMPAEVDPVEGHKTGTSIRLHRH